MLHQGDKKKDMLPTSFILEQRVVETYSSQACRPITIWLAQKIIFLKR
jgi:hypothetical protein